VPSLHGVLVVDKPAGLTSHDVVAAARRLTGERRIGHTGTLDPMATGVLPLAIGRATRLARFLLSSDKEYDAAIRFGVTTDSYDSTGVETGRTNRAPSYDELVRGLQTLSGSYLQMPPPHSAKKVGGRRAYELARASEPVELRPVPVTVSRLHLAGYEDGVASVTLTCSAGFYVRSFAHALGDIVGTGACLEALRRTRSGSFQIAGSVPLEMLADPGRVRAALVDLDDLLPDLPAVAVTSRGREHVLHGRELGPGDYSPAPVGAASPDKAPTDIPVEWVRLVDEQGALVAMATPGSAPASLHPSVVLI
jgi:tRNA pseudouridine55 synthase